MVGYRPDGNFELPDVRNFSGTGQIAAIGLVELVLREAGYRSASARRIWPSDHAEPDPR